MRITAGPTRRPIHMLLLQFILLSSLTVALQSGSRLAEAQASLTAGPTLPYPILFVTQPPLPQDFTTMNAVFGNHQADLQSSNRGGDLWIRYPDGALKNLTAAAGYGMDGFQGANAIAVRDPAVHWDGNKALFSMVIGAPTQQYQGIDFHWQLYEITGLGHDETPIISKVTNQPANYNNVSPIYGTDERIIFTSDRPFNGAAHLYPQRDEYEEAPTVSGLWGLDPVTGDLRLLNHAPSGDFTPTIDSFGRVIFTQWDHLQRDQQADADANVGSGQNCDSGSNYGTFNYADERANAVELDDRSEVFPEPRACRGDLLAGSNLNGHSFNHFLPWQIHEDGTEAEILNHLGRHELHGYVPASINDDLNVVEYYGQLSRFNPNRMENMLQVRESPLTPGLYYGVDAPEFGTHAAGQVVSLNAPPTVNADHIQVVYVTHRDTASTDDSPGPNHSGLYRDPLPLSNGLVIAAHSSDTRQDSNVGSREAPQSRYSFRLQTLSPASNGSMAADQFLTSGISETVSWWDPDVKVSYSGLLWELQPVEVRARPRPTRLSSQLPGPEQQVFAQAGVDPVKFQAFLRQENLALLVTRNVTSRDDFDKQQPFNLRVPGGVQTIGAPGKVYDVAHLQLFQADLIRGIKGCCSDQAQPGRRVLAQVVHDAAALSNNPTNPGGPAGSVQIAADGSVALFAPANRALTWQITDPSGVGVVRERNWLTFQPGEIRVCGSCHGLSELDQAGQPAPTNPPQALLALLQEWKAQHGDDDPPPAITGAPPQIAGCPIFPADNIWNTTVYTLPVASNSAAYVTTIGANAVVHADFGSGAWEGGPIGIPFVIVPGSQAKVPISFEYAGESDPGPYPIPANAPIEGGSGSSGDRHMLLLERDSCTLYEVYKAYAQENGSWQAGSGAIFDLASHDLRPSGWTSADAAGLPILPGLVRYEEVVGGEINHAIRFTAPQTRNSFVWPARHQASDLSEAHYPPMGQRFRLKADFDIADFSPQVQVILTAMQRYGIILADNGSAWYISGAPDERWDNDLLHELDRVTGADFEAVDGSAPMVNIDSGQVRFKSAPPTELPNRVYLPQISK